MKLFHNNFLSELIPGKLALDISISLAPEGYRIIDITCKKANITMTHWDGRMFLHSIDQINHGYEGIMAYYDAKSAPPIINN